LGTKEGRVSAIKSGGEASAIEQNPNFDRARQSSLEKERGEKEEELEREERGKRPRD